MTARLLVLARDPHAITEAVRLSGLDAVCSLAGDPADHDCVLVDLAHARAVAGAPLICVVDAPGEAEAAELAALDVIRTDLPPARFARRIGHALRVHRADVISHDLRTPLHAIGLAADALRELVAPEAQRYVDIIDRASARIEKLLA